MTIALTIISAEGRGREPGVLILWLMSFWRDYACAMMQRHVQVGKAERQRGRLGLMHQPQLQHAVTGTGRQEDSSVQTHSPGQPSSPGSTAEAVSFPWFMQLPRALATLS